MAGLEPPGVSIQARLNELGMTQKDLATRMGRTPKMVNQLINAKTGLTPATAIALEYVLGVKAQVWLQVEADYRIGLARQRQTDEVTRLGPEVARIMDEVRGGMEPR